MFINTLLWLAGIISIGVLLWFAAVLLMFLHMEKIHQKTLKEYEPQDIV